MSGVSRTVIVSAVRTPFGRLGGGLKDRAATELGAIVIRAALERIGLEGSEVEYVIMGQVLQAGAGQAPARQAAIGAGLPIEVPSDTVNKVCASSIRAVEIADSMIRAGDVEVVVTGGMESMSNAPYALPKARFGYKMGDGDARRPDDLGRPTLDLRREAHGAAGRARRARARDHARGAGRLGGPLARARREGAGRRRLRRRDRRRRRRRRGRGDPARHHARKARLAEAGDGSRRDDHGGKRARASTTARRA